VCAEGHVEDPKVAEKCLVGRGAVDAAIKIGAPPYCSHGVPTAR
jgi:hypothetical protein